MLVEQKHAEPSTIFVAGTHRSLAQTGLLSGFDLGTTHIQNPEPLDAVINFRAALRETLL
ncbi:hypothetical protein GS597_04725 [Synechococcales cyanobacterium C]|uniref:Uncharacterized protein n=1 Tax=Petrachloros mirabilis ULC683 TaxID=2781853 RepID=A0A8K2A671_9CYAN|nr:hypothetical protein [Petrachloros mirabilis]NCJ05824.1 hypothetical protein [Petrachloros mirabilis ULC683]